jgi:hypothetical protein
MSSLEELSKDDIVFRLISDCFIKSNQLKGEEYFKDHENSQDLYQRLFNKHENLDMKLAFYWSDDDYSGSLFIVYAFKIKNEHKIRFVYTYGEYGSCDWCDPYPWYQEDLDRIYYNIQGCYDIDDIKLYNKEKKDFINPYLIQDFSIFKLNFEF